MHHVHKIVPVEIEYTEGQQDASRGVFRGGVPAPDFLEELAIDLAPDEAYDETVDDFAPNGRTQLNIRGSRRACFALARYLLTLCDLNTQDPDYHDHFEQIRDSHGALATHVIVHAPLPEGEDR